MTELTEIESLYLNLREGNISISEFEKWVYSSETLEALLNEDEYTELISYNFTDNDSIYKLGKILKSKLRENKFQTLKVINLIDSVIAKDGYEGQSLISMYSLYKQGYYFLEDLGLNIGDQLRTSTHYGSELYINLPKERQEQIINKLYPRVRELAIEMKNWISNNELILTGTQDKHRNNWQYIDNRSEEDKKSRIW